jgi:hypothetical protein
MGIRHTEVLRKANTPAQDVPPELAAISGETRVPSLYGFMGAFVPVAFVILCLRLYARWRFTNIGIDDILVTIAFVRQTPPLPRIREVGIHSELRADLSCHHRCSI